MYQTVSRALATDMIFSDKEFTFITTQEGVVSGKVLATELMTPHHYKFCIRDKAGYRYYADVRVAG